MCRLLLQLGDEPVNGCPGTLIVVSHDRYLLERVTDQQYAILDGRLRHVPGGVDEYLRLRELERTLGAQSGSRGQAAATPASAPALAIRRRCCSVGVRRDVACDPGLSRVAG